MELRSVQLGFEEVAVKCYQHSSLLGDDPMNPNIEQVHLPHWVFHHAKEFLKIKKDGGDKDPTTVTAAATNNNKNNKNKSRCHHNALIV